MMKRSKQSVVLAAVAAGALAIGACGSAAPPVGPVELGATNDDGPVATTPGAAGQGASPDPAPGQGQDVSLDGEYLVDMGEVGTARFAVQGFQLSLVDLQPAQGWQVVKEEYEPDEIEIDLVNGPVRVDLEVEIDDGRFETELDIDRPAVPGPYTYTVGEAGTVTIDTDGRGVMLVGQDTAPGWVATVDQEELAEGEVEIDFRDEAGRVAEFDAEVDDGELEVEIDTATPPGAGER